MVTTFYLPIRLIFGVGALSELGKEAKELGRKALVVTGRDSMKQGGVLTKVTDDLNKSGVDSIIFDKVVPNPRAATIDEGAQLVRKEGIDFIIGLGGGSTMDTAKGIALASSGTRPVLDYIIGKAEVTGRVRPIILVPTVAASGSEANNFAAITNWETRQKLLLINPCIFPKVSIIDPELTLTLPLRPTQQGAVDIFCHAAEGYITSKQPSPITDGLIETVLKTVVATAPKVAARLDDIQVRTLLSWSSTLACSQFLALGGGRGTFTLHAISNPLTGYFDVAHGDGLAALLPTWMKYTYLAVPERFNLMGRNVFGEKDGIAAIEKWLFKIGMRLRLRDLGIDPEAFDEIADEAARSSRAKDHPSVLDAATIKRLYTESY